METGAGGYIPDSAIRVRTGKLKLPRILRFPLRTRHLALKQHIIPLIFYQHRRLHHPTRTWQIGT